MVHSLTPQNAYTFSLPLRVIGSSITVLMLSATA